MGWIVYSLLAVVGLAVWGMLSRLALEHATWAQAVFLFGVATVVALGGALVVLRDQPWQGRGIWLSSLTGAVGVLGFVFYYLALERGKASAVVPVIGIYPTLTAVLAVMFLSESVTPLQVGGIVLALVGATLVGIGA